VFNILTDSQLALFDNLAPFQTEARYPEHKEQVAKTLAAKHLQELLSETEAFLCWTKQRLEK
jgi:hypothetical protein